MSKRSTKTNFGPMAWYQVWWLSITQPNMDVYRDLMARAVRPIRTAYLWIGIVGLISGVMRLITFLLVNFRNPAITSLPPSVFTLVLSSLVIIVVWFTAITGITHLSARVLRGSGRFVDTLYLKAVHSAPILLALTIIAYTVPSQFQQWVAIPLILYQIVLSLPTVRAIYGFDIAKGIVAGVIIPVLVLVLIGAAVYFSGYRLEPVA